MIATPSPLLIVASANLLEPLLKKVKSLHITDVTWSELKNNHGELQKEVERIEAMINKNRIKVENLPAKRRLPIMPASRRNGFSPAENSSVELFNMGGFDIVFASDSDEQRLYQDNKIQSINVFDIANICESKCGVTAQKWGEAMRKAHRVSSAFQQNAE